MACETLAATKAPPIGDNLDFHQAGPQLPFHPNDIDFTDLSSSGIIFVIQDY